MTGEGEDFATKTKQNKKLEIPQKGIIENNQ